MSIDPSYLEALFEVSPVCIAVADERGRYVDVNRAYCDTFGYAREELLGRSFKLILKPEDQHLEAGILSMALANVASAPTSWQVRVRDGRTLSVRSAFRCLRMPDGSVRIVTFLSDVSVLHDAFARLERSEALAQHLNEHLEQLVGERTAELRAANLALERLAREDPLTGAANRRHFAEYTGLAMERARRYCQPLSLVVFDLDHFKEVNDGFGHRAGDEVLVCVAQRTRALLRSSDLLGRWGGEEFALVLPETDCQAAAQVAHKLAGAIGERAVATCAGEIKVTCSGGVAEWCAEDLLEDLVARADAALYRAKAAGRNCMLVA
jgi:diguanylate cyclase (GGDEF)-like protein/PAS domain S-box-containing protein